MKATKIFSAALAAIAGLMAGHAEAALGCRAEYGEQQCIPGLTAAASLNNHQFGAVRMAAATTVNIASEILVSGALTMAVGVLQNKPYNGEPAQVCYSGLSKVFAGGAITAGALITYDSSGHFVDAASGSIVMGRSFQAAATAGEKVIALIFPPVKWGSVA